MCGMALLVTGYRRRKSYGETKQLWKALGLVETPEPDGHTEGVRVTSFEATNLKSRNAQKWRDSEPKHSADLDSTLSSMPPIVDVGQTIWVSSFWSSVTRI